MTSILAWMQANPVFTTLIVYPILTFVFTWATRERTTEEYAAMNPFVAGVLRFIAAVGFDGPKIIAAIKTILSGPQQPPTAGNGRATERGVIAPRLLLTLLALPTLAVFVIALASALTGCAAFRGGARSALDVATVACLIAHQELPDSDVAKVCSVADDLFGPMRQVLAESRTASARAAQRASAARCN